MKRHVWEYIHFHPLHLRRYQLINIPNVVWLEVKSGKQRPPFSTLHITYLHSNKISVTSCNPNVHQRIIRWLSGRWVCNRHAKSTSKCVQKISIQNLTTTMITFLYQRVGIRLSNDRIHFINSIGSNPRLFHYSHPSRSQIDRTPVQIIGLSKQPIPHSLQWQTLPGQKKKKISFDNFKGDVELYRHENGRMFGSYYFVGALHCTFWFLFAGLSLTESELDKKRKRTEKQKIEKHETSETSNHESRWDSRHLFDNPWANASALFFTTVGLSMAYFVHRISSR